MAQIACASLRRAIEITPGGPIKEVPYPGKEAPNFFLRGSIMNIIRRTPSAVSNYRPPSIDEQFGRLVENMFDDFFTPFAPLSNWSRMNSEGVHSPRINVVETDKSFEIEAELPGVKKEDIKVSVDNQRVTIEAETRQETQQPGDGENVVYAERSARKYLRSFVLPTDVDDDKSQARLENGVLTMSLPKKQDTQAKRLTIQ
jgi:HSP20 family protein